ncbi:UNVERIFIED_ORG: integrating conjugative element relaxase (TIGR03760 family) [Pseudomonas psychrophila]
MLSFFRCRKIPHEQATPQNGLWQPASSQALLAPARRQKLLENIWQRASLSRQQFVELYRQPLERYAELVQQLPASQNHHHAYPGGMLDHGLEIVAYALKIRQTYLLPIGAPPESQSAQAEAWTAAAAYGALIHDLGKIAVDLHVELEDGATWHPWHGPITQPYRFRHVKGRNYHLHGAAAALIYAQILTPNILDWLSGFPEAWSQLIFILSGQYEHAGILSEIVVKADQASVAQELGGNPARALDAPKQSLQRQLADGLRYLVRETYKLNQPDGPSDGWLTQDALWLVSKPVSDQLRAYLLTQGIEGVPTSNAPFFNMLQDQGVIQTNAQDKAIWKATIDNNKGWRNTFTLLKLSPALIWSDPGDRPPVYFGTLEVETDTSIEEVASNESSVKHNLPAMALSKAAPNPPASAVPLPDFCSPTATPPDDLDALMALLGGDTQALPPPTDPVMTEVENDSVARAPDAQTTEVADAAAIQKTQLGQAFIDWLKEGVHSRKLIINDAKALVHTVSGTAMLVTPGIFKRFVQEFPALEAQAKAQELNAWQLVQRGFEKLKLHRKTQNSLNIWTVNVVGPRSSKKLRGYLLNAPSLLFCEIPFDNVSLSLVNDSAEGAA